MDESNRDPVGRRGFLKGAAASAAAFVAQPNDAGAQDAVAHDHQVVPSDLTLRVKALESLLVDKGLVDRVALDAIVDAFETKIGPRNGARVVARAWVDPAQQGGLLTDATARWRSSASTAIRAKTSSSLENTPKVHNMVVCTLCSCYPWPVLGLPPVWYKSAAYRSRAVIDPRGVLKEFGLDIADDVEVRVWDSTAEIRYLVLPERPRAANDLNEDALAALVTRDSMLGTAKVSLRRPEEAHERRSRHGRHAGHGADSPRDPRADVPRALGGARVRAVARAAARGGQWNLDAFATASRCCLRPTTCGMSYYERWFAWMLPTWSRPATSRRRRSRRDRPASGSPETSPFVTMANVSAMVAKRARRTRDVAGAPRFKAGQRVRARNMHPPGHTRLPRYVRGKAGSSFATAACSVSRHERALARRKTAALYSVRFAARELWGDHASPRDFVHLDLWDDYLEQM